jgi:hypothetical protein
MGSFFPFVFSFFPFRFFRFFFFRFRFFMTRRFADADAPNVTKHKTIICSICNPLFSTTYHMYYLSYNFNVIVTNIAFSLCFV